MYGAVLKHQNNFANNFGKIVLLYLSVKFLVASGKKDSLCRWLTCHHTFARCFITF